MLLALPHKSHWTGKEMDWVFERDKIDTYNKPSEFFKLVWKTFDFPKQFFFLSQSWRYFLRLKALLSITWLHNVFFKESVFCPEVLSEWWSQLCANISVCPFLVQYTLHTGGIVIKFSPISTVHFLLSVGGNGGKKKPFQGFEYKHLLPPLISMHVCVHACVWSAPSHVLNSDSSVPQYYS